MSELAQVKKALPMFPHMLPEDLRLIRKACEAKKAKVKGVTSIATLDKAIAECDRILASA